jgi:hypothetical protein
MLIPKISKHMSKQDVRKCGTSYIIVSRWFDVMSGPFDKDKDDWEN